MNWDEFEAWAETALADVVAPSQQKLDRLRRMLGEVVLTDPPMVEQAFLDRYWSPYQHEKLVMPDGIKWDSVVAFSMLGAKDYESIK